MMNSTLNHAYGSTLTIEVSLQWQQRTELLRSLYKVSPQRARAKHARELQVVIHLPSLYQYKSPIGAFILVAADGFEPPTKGL